MELKVATHRSWIIMIGGILAMLLAPIMVIIKYMTGWNIIPEPSWIEPVSGFLSPILSFAPAQELWSFYGTFYSLALLMMISGIWLLWKPLRLIPSRWLKIAFWIFFAGLVQVLAGDFVHSITWHQNGIMTPTPGSNPVANTGYAVGMMGMNFILIGSLIFGIKALQGKYLPKWLAWSFILITPSAPLLSTTVLPTTPSGGLLFFALISVLLGYQLLKNRIYLGKMAG